MMKKTVVKVILSTMTDMADMLGSYEQVGDEAEAQISIDIQEQPYEIVCNEIKRINLKYHSNTLQRKP